MAAFALASIVSGRVAQRTPDRFDRQMKKAVVPTTAAKGTAVSNRRMTAVQSVYIPAVETLSIIPGRGGCCEVRTITPCNESFHNPPREPQAGVAGV